MVQKGPAELATWLEPCSLPASYFCKYEYSTYTVDYSFLGLPVIRIINPSGGGGCGKWSQKITGRGGWLFDMNLI